MAEPTGLVARLPRPGPAAAFTLGRRGVFALIAIAGAAAAIAAAVTTWSNPLAVPGGVGGASIRALYVVAYVGVGLVLWQRRPDQRIGQIVVISGFVVAVWTLNGAADPLVFGVARLFGLFGLPAIALLMLAYPEGRLHTSGERCLVWGSAALLALCWVPLTLITTQPTVSAPMVRCAPHCPHNVFYLGGAPALEHALAAGLRLGHVALMIGTVALLVRRHRRSTRPARRMLAPVQAAYAVFAVLLVAYLVLSLRHADGDATAVSAWLLMLATAALPVAILVGLVRERSFRHTAVGRIVTALPQSSEPGQLGPLIASTLRDGSLVVLAWDPDGRRYVDDSGCAVSPPPPESGLTLTPLQHHGSRVGAIIHDRALDEDPLLISAVASAATLATEKARLADDLSRSRRRLIEAADRERERLERNLHDGAQQRLVAIRLRLELAAEAIAASEGDPLGLLAELGDELDAALDELRQLARGIYPPLLAEHGLADALAAAGRRLPTPALVRCERLGRFPRELEAGIYFCCLEALQNAVKHAGRDAAVSVRLWHSADELRFEVADRGRGFGEPTHHVGGGLTTMRDRIGALGGWLEIQSAPGHGTTVAGGVPLS